MIITIDGPAASGKSTVAQLLAQKRGAFYINSGLIFRALAFILLKNPQEFIKDSQALEQLLKNSLDYQYSPTEGPLIWYKNRIINPLLKSTEVSSYASVIATEPAVRTALLQYQHTLADYKNVIADGRDCGTVVFPQAEFKFFITAQKCIRAERFQKELALQHKQISLEESCALIQERDQRDSTRTVAPLEKAPDAFCIDTSFLSIEETLQCILSRLPSI